jgi:PHD/YefM family antitoxin component YafN of YafNO toxin-antitoxin module
VIEMQITTREIEKTLDKYEDIKEPIIVKRENKADVVIISLKEYKEKMQEMEIIKHLKKSEEDIENGNTSSANEFFKELRTEFGY